MLLSKSQGTKDTKLNNVPFDASLESKINGENETHYSKSVYVESKVQSRFYEIDLEL